jgi:hypothetical protein
MSNNHTAIDLLAIKYPNYMDNSQQRKVYPVKYSTAAQQAKQLISDILFNQLFNYVLIRLPGQNQLFICEPTNKEKREYSRREITYHPLMQEF